MAALLKISGFPMMNFGHFFAPSPPSLFRHLLTFPNVNILDPKPKHPETAQPEPKNLNPKPQNLKPKFQLPV